MIFCEVEYDSDWLYKNFMVVVLFGVIFIIGRFLLDLNWDKGGGLYIELVI